jgi:hypothetical protein
VCHGRLSAPFLDGVFASISANPLSKEVDDNAKQAEECSERTISTEGTIVASSIDEVDHTVGSAEADESSEGANDHEDGTRTSWVRIEE